MQIAKILVNLASIVDSNINTDHITQSFCLPYTV